MLRQHETIGREEVKCGVAVLLLLLCPNCCRLEHAEKLGEPHHQVVHEHIDELSL
jgi:hypothetical protein